jgi:leucyl aminopeptidase
VSPRHQGRIIKLEYNPPKGSEVEQTLFLVGKGITYDTGGADVKTGGNMVGMHRYIICITTIFIYQVL